MSRKTMKGNCQSILICCGATSCAVVAGYAISFSSVAMDDLRNEKEQVQLTKEQGTWFGVCKSQYFVVELLHMIVSTNHVLLHNQR